MNILDSPELKMPNFEPQDFFSEGGSILEERKGSE